MDRKCRKCGETKPLEEFHASRKRNGVKTAWFQCKGCYYKQITEWHHRNRARSREIKMASRIRNRDAELQKSRERYWMDHSRTRTIRNAAQAKRRAANPEQHRAYLAKRRRQLRVATDHFTASDVRTIFQTQRGRCAENTCLVSLNAGYHVDHIMPLALGGTNSVQNIQLLCPPCNMRKRDLHPVRWAQSHGRLF